MKFNEFNLKPELIHTLDDMGFEEPTPIQQQAIPHALEGRDVIGQAQTGTGKTAAFGLPMLNKIHNNNKGIQGIVIAPTRELAIQVQEEIFRLGKDVRARVFTVYGGTSIQKQIERIKRNHPQIIVGTPGRVLDLINRRVLNLKDIETVILDEADEMLNMGFIDDIKAIIQKTPATRQTLLFSATMPPAIKKLGEQFLTDAIHVKIEAKEMTADLIEQYFVKLKDNEKFDVLTRFMDVQNPDQAIIFCRTKKRVDEVGRGLTLRGYNSELIHGDVTQQKRSSVINEFRQGRVEILVATDVAARGLDISGVTHVYNYDIPQDPESYVHRIGRTGRAGKDGMSLSFVTHNEMSYLKTIENLTRKQMKPLSPPTSEEVEHGQVQQLVDQINEILESNEANKHRNTAKMLLAHYEANDLVSALLKEVLSENNDVEVVISPQKPLPNAGGQKSKNNKKYNRRRSNNRNDRGGNNRGKQGYKGKQGNKGKQQGNNSDRKSKNFKIKSKND
ncbi:DEAD/DEAH box helicase [Aerococcaceae bacterium INB8]|uniref:ATP-dependent RNA helicase CshA n=1 Tax=Ruoffia halotolerans TaxID=2748684 RepID=A0A839A722_9LACT|nr:DEAD/DEAH box helicase [Ruoffia halotolerans]MBA5729802.1 DEAD/DEAH box helicase [Ruoffia halotolerans]